jgi:hypothetical protein
MSLDDREEESGHLIEKGLVGSEPRTICWLVVQGLPDGGGCFRQL